MSTVTTTSASPSADAVPLPENNGDTALQHALDTKYNALWVHTAALDEGAQEDDWRSPVSRYFAPPAVADSGSSDAPLAGTSQRAPTFTAEQTASLDQIAAKYASSGEAYLARLGEPQLALIFEAAVPQNFRALLSAPGSAVVAGAPYIFPIKTCLALWGEVEALGLNHEEQFAFILRVAEIWQSLDEIFAEFTTAGLTPVHGEDFWKRLTFDIVIKTAEVDKAPETPRSGLVVGGDPWEHVFSRKEKLVVCQAMLESAFAQLSDYLELQKTYSADKEFPRMFLVSREAKGYGLPPNVAIDEETQLLLYDAWLTLPPESRPSVKSVRASVRTTREKIDRLVELGIITAEPATLLHYKQDFFHDILVTLVQGDTTLYRESMTLYDKQITAGEKWAAAKAQFTTVSDEYSALTVRIGKYDGDVMSLSREVLIASQDLPGWWNISETADKAYSHANAESLWLQHVIGDRASFNQQLPESKTRYADAMRAHLEAYIALQRACGADEETIQTLLFNAYQGQVPGFENEALPAATEIFTAKYLKSLGLDFSTIKLDAPVDPIVALVREEKWHTAWSEYSRAMYRDMATCTIENPDGLYREIPPEPVEKGSMAERPKPGPTYDVLRPDIVKLRFNQLIELTSHDPDFAAFNDFVTESQPLMAVLHVLLMGMHDDETNTHIMGFLHPKMNRPEDAVTLIKNLAEGFYRKYFTVCNQHTESFNRAIAKLRSALKYFEPEKLGLNPAQTDYVNKMKMLCEVFSPGDKGKCKFQELLEVVRDPGFSAYSFERAVLVYGPDIAGAVAGAVLLGMVSGGAGTVVVGGSRVAAALRYIWILTRSSAVMSLGSVAGKEAARYGMEHFQENGTITDYGARSYYTLYQEGKLTGDEIFTRIIGEGGRELFALMGFEREQPDANLFKLCDDFSQGKTDFGVFMSKLLGEYGQQAVMMFGVGALARGLGALAGRWIASGQFGYRHVGQLIKRFAGFFDSLGDRIALGQGIKPAEFGKVFGAEFIEEVIEQSAGQAHPALELIVSVLNSSRVADVDVTGLVSHNVTLGDEESGFTMQNSYTFNAAGRAKLLENLRARTGMTQTIEENADGSINVISTDKTGISVREEYFPSNIPKDLRTALMDKVFGIHPDEFLAGLGITGFNENGEPVWEEGADVNAAKRRLVAFGFIVNERVVNGRVVLQLDWTARRGKTKVEGRVNLAVPAVPVTGNMATIPASIITRATSMAARGGRPVHLFWSDTEKTYVPIQQSIDGAPVIADPALKRLAVFQNGIAPTSDTVASLLSDARAHPGESQTVRVFDVTGTTHADFRLTWNESMLTVDHVGGTANVTGEDMAIIDQRVDEILALEQAELAGVIGEG